MNRILVYYFSRIHIIYSLPKLKDIMSFANTFLFQQTTKERV